MSSHADRNQEIDRPLWGNWSQRGRNWVTVLQARLDYFPGQPLSNFGGFCDGTAFSNEAWNVRACGD